MISDFSWRYDFSDFRQGIWDFTECQTPWSGGPSVHGVTVPSCTTAWYGNCVGLKSKLGPGFELWLGFSLLCYFFSKFWCSICHIRQYRKCQTNSKKVTSGCQTRGTCHLRFSLTWFRIFVESSLDSKIPGLIPFGNVCHVISNTRRITKFHKNVNGGLDYWFQNLAQLLTWFGIVANLLARPIYTTF